MLGRVLRALLLLTGAASLLGMATPPRTLIFEERVQAQIAIERVYWSHRLWPTGNALAKPAFEQAVPESLIRARVTRYLRQSEALKEFWGISLTNMELQAELVRMASQTRSPAVLRELLSALHDDATVVAECLVRPLLADRLIRSRYARDARFHSATRQLAETALVDRLKSIGAQPMSGGNATSSVGTSAVALSSDGAPIEPSFLGAGGVEPPLEAPSSTVVDPATELGALREDDDRFFATVAIEAPGGEYELRTESWPKEPFDRWWTGIEQSLPLVNGSVASDYQLPSVATLPCATDTWSTIGGGGPIRRYGSTAVWTGTELIVWGGTDGANFFSNGGKYDPATDTWKPLRADAPAPHGRAYHTAVWSGTEMIIWGGQYTSSNCCTSVFLNTGGRYDPTTDTWQPTSTAAPDARAGQTAVWSGSEMLVWGGWAGGNNYYKTGSRYNPATNTWRTLAQFDPATPANRSVHMAVWTGTEMVVWGGYSTLTGHLKSGGRYDPVTNRWRPTRLDSSTPSAREGHAMVWSGGEVLIWGGHNTSTYPTDGARYDPVADTWTPMRNDPTTPPPRTYTFGIWSGTEMIVWGGYRSGSYFNSGGRYDPASDTWLSTDLVTAPEERSFFMGAWTGQEMLIWGGSNPVSHLMGNGSRYDPAADRWTAMSRNGPPENDGNVHIWTGAEMLAWGATGSKAGARYDPATDAWRPMSVSGAPIGRYSPVAAWSGSELIVWGGDATGSGDYQNSGARYDPATDSWRQLPIDADTPTPRGIATGGWTDSGLIVWGGYNSGYLNSGARYDPLVDRWFRIRNDASAPSPRGSASFVWTGSEAFLWGGYDGAQLATGGLYDPAADTWRASRPNPSLPTAWSQYSAIWTGHDVILWGGASVSGILNAGWRYDPSHDAWSPTGIDAATPTPRAGHSGIWDGTEMIVWGGWTTPTNPFGLVQTGGRYAPATDTWTPTSIGPYTPSARSWHSALWTGTEMIIWGSNPFPDPLGGASYCGCIGPMTTYYLDHDHDGYGTLGVGVNSCVGPPEGYTTNTDDCNDNDADVHPGAPETCNGLDEDCDGVSDNGNPGGEDACGSNVGTCRQGVTTCTAGAFICSGIVGPTAEVCDGLDNDCDGAVPANEADIDGDGFRLCQGDCSDGDSVVHPGAVELPGNTSDEDCDGVLTCSSTAFYKTHGDFVRCVARDCGQLVTAGLVSQAQCDTIISHAGQSNVGRRQRLRTPPTPAAP